MLFGPSHLLMVARAAKEAMARAKMGSANDVTMLDLDAPRMRSVSTRGVSMLAVDAPTYTERDALAHDEELARLRVRPVRLRRHHQPCR
jgi:hypothetical protein